jgi:hypothetical protein
MLFSVLKMARSVKLFAFGTPFQGQRGVWLPALARETRARVTKNDATRGRVNIVVLSKPCRTWIYMPAPGRPRIFGTWKSQTCAGGEDQKMDGARFSRLRNAIIPVIQTTML